MVIKMCSARRTSAFKLLLFLLYIINFFGRSADACPSLYPEVKEHTPIGTVIAEFVTDAEAVELEADDSAFDGFLQVVKNGSQTYHVILSKYLDLLQLNPNRPLPVPITEEEIQCDNDSNSGSDIVTNQLSHTKTIQYTIKCSIAHASQVIEVTSDLRLIIQDVNDNVPYFMCAPYHKTVDELTPIGTTVFTLKGLAADLDLEGGISEYGYDSTDGTFALVGAASEGYITVEKELDYDRGPRTYQLNITTTDTGDPPRTNWTYLYIHVEDADDQNPIFDQHIHYLTLKEENTTILNERILTSPPIRAHDLDTGINATIEYEIIAGHSHNDKVYFQIDKESGEIIPIRSLNREEKQQFVITIKGYQKDKPQMRFSYATLIIDVADSNTHPPVMSAKYYNVSLPENSPNDFQVVQVKAEDGDSGSNGEFSYYLIDPGGAFGINSVTGSVYIVASSALDRETQDVFIAYVYAKETNTEEKRQSGNSTIFITLVDTNDNSPVFKPNYYECLVNKTESIGHIIGQVTATDKDEGQNANITYSIAYSNDGDSDLFNIDSKTGAISVQKSLLSLPSDKITVTVEARDQPLHSSQSRATVAHVRINILSVNDNPPDFVNQPYIVDVYEDLTIGKSVIKVKATDIDGTVPGGYTIIAGNELNQFSIDSDSGLITIASVLDRESVSRYNLSVRVTDGKYEVVSVVVINILDANDNSPDFMESVYQFNMTEETGENVFLGTVQAVDPDSGNNSEIEYSLVGDGANRLFNINSTTGEIRTNININREEVPQILFSVSASDKGNPTRSSAAVVTVQVADINDNAPLFPSGNIYRVTVPERSAPGFILQIKASDLDVGENQVTRYALLSGDTSLFSVSPLTGDVSTLVDLNPEQTDHETQYMLEIMAYNVEPYQSTETMRNDTTYVMVVVKDVNDNSPVFTMPVYDVLVPEDTPVGDTVYRVVANDKDSSSQYRQVRYWIDSGVDSFMVDEFTGDIRLMKPLDRDTPSNQRTMSFTVHASDMLPSKPSMNIVNGSATVNITVGDINDNAPRFSRALYSVSILENATIGDSIDLKVEATDKDSGENGMFIYDIVTIGSPVQINGQTGNLTVSRSLDFDEGQQEYQVMLVASDAGQPVQTGSATLKITIVNVNDNEPSFKKEEYRFEINENQPSQTLLGLVSAKDLDGDSLVYRLVGNAIGFTISESGELRTDASLDYEDQVVHSLVVEVEETADRNGQTVINPHKVMVSVLVTVLDVNDNEPKFGQATYHGSIREGADTAEVLQLQASDDDSGRNGDIRYRIISGNDGGIFHINESLGLLWADGSKVDHKTTAKFRLVVEARDGGNPALRGLCTVDVTVTDTNNHIPMFDKDTYKAEVKENQKDAFVTRVTATDDDQSDRLVYSIVHTDTSFSINPDNGMVYTSSSLNRETRDVVSINISVSDGAHTAYTTLVVQVLDENDNKPVFGSESYKKTLSEGTTAGRSVLTVKAEDADAGQNGLVTHWMTGTYGKFQIDPITGVVSTTSSFTEGDETSYEMTVYAKDHGENSFIVSTSLTVYINNTNMHAPEFSEFAYEVIAAENTQLNVPLVTFTVTDKDEQEAGMVDLRISKGDDKGLFRINTRNELVLQSNLDYEDERFYTLNIEAKDRAGDSKTTTAKVYVTVTDINDQPPVFMPAPDVVLVSGPVTPGLLLFQFSAIDGDSSANGNNDINFRLLSSADSFSINHLIGELRAKDIIDGDYTVKVQAFDLGSPSLSADVTIVVRVQDGNTVDLYPVFEQYVYRVTFNESRINVPIHLVNMNAKIKEKAADEDVFYNITGGPKGEAFSINSNTGEISVFQTLDREEFSSHTLVVSAYNSANPAFSTHTSVYVTVEDVNDFAPYFPFPEFDVTIMENASVPSTIVQLQAIDEDISPQLNYEILDNGGASDYFKLVSSANVATITLDRPLDRESMSPAQNGIYAFWVNVDDGPTMHNGIPAYIRIKVLDVNDNPPRFNASSYSANVAENASPCQELIRLTAVDPDVSDEDLLHYSIIGSMENPFEIDSKSAMVRVRCDVGTKLDRESQGTYRMMVNVTDNAGHTAQTLLDIRVDDINDNSPDFIGTPYTANTVEGRASLDLRAYVSARDLDFGNNSRIVFALHERHQAAFTISTQPDGGNYLGTISPIVELDREEAGLAIVNGSAIYPVTVIATDQGDPSLSSSTTVTMIIGDINDSPPVFERTAYDVSISEGTPVDTTIITFLANDPDLPENTNMTYSMSASEVFGIDAQTGAVMVTGSLDVNKQSVFTLALTASDGVFSTSATLRVSLVDINDQDPEFTQPVYYFSVPENDESGRIGDFVGQVVAYDSDRGDNGVVVYNITNRAARGLFSIEPSDGSISVSGIIDRENDEKYTIIVTSNDKGSPPRMSTCEVEIDILDVNDNEPEFINTPYTGSIKEHSPAGATVFINGEEHPLVSAFDLDSGINAEVTFSLVGESANLFSIDDVTGEVTVSEAGAGILDRESSPTIDIEVAASDAVGTNKSLSATTRIRVTLEDINDQSPVFERSQYGFSVNEMISPGSLVGAVRATDGDVTPNNRITYSLTSGGQGRFFIDKFSGEISSLGQLDRETIAIHTLNISATDNGVTPGPLETFTTVVVTVTDFNDNAPAFILPVSSVLPAPENQQPLYQVGLVKAEDPDIGVNSRIIYDIDDDSKAKFSIDQTSGNLSTIVSLDRETLDRYTVIVTASDRGSPSLSSSTTLTIRVLDENDHTPVFSQSEYRVNILEKSPMNSAILYASASDKDEGDNGRLTYSLSGKAGVQQYFAVDSNSGLVKIAQPVDKATLAQKGLLGGSNKSVVEMELFVTDAGSPSLTGSALLLVKIDEVNDDAPQFNNISYIGNVLEGSAEGITVLNVAASVRDANTIISYSVIGSDHFKMKDSFTGEVVTKSTLDREAQSSHSFTVRAVDNRIPQRTAYAAVKITVLDENDNDPTFPQLFYMTSMREGTYTASHVISQMSATDEDEGINSEIRYTLSGVTGSDTKGFTCDPITGVVSIAGSLDREERGQYNLTLTSTDQGREPRSSSMVIILNVEDVNDNPPVFSRPVYTANVSKSAQTGDLVAEIDAVDIDYGINALFSYEFIGPQSTFYVQTKGAKGHVRLASSLAGSAVGQTYQLILTAVDMGSPSLNSTSKLIVTVSEPAFGVPLFSQSLYMVTIADDTPVSSTIQQLNAGTDDYQYSIIDGNDDNLFSINAASGALYTSSSLRGMKQTSYLLNIQVEDTMDLNTRDTAQVMVTVIEGSDFPVFDQSEYTATFPENVQNSLPRLVIDLNTTDERIGRKLFYYFIDNEYEGMFSMDNSTGQIWCTSVLDREKTAEFTLKVGCDRLSANRRKRRQIDESNEAVVIISVEDENDNKPYFTSDPLIYGLPSTADFNYLVATIKAEDADSGNNSVCRYASTGGDDADYFYLNENTGELNLVAALAATGKTNFQFSVSATDNVGQGKKTDVDVKIFVLTNSERVVLVAKIPPAQFIGRENDLLRNLSSILGWQLQIEKIQPHSVERDGTPHVDVTMTDMYFYAVESGGLVPRDEVLQKVEEKATEIEALFALFKVDEVKPVVFEKTRLGFALSPAEAALIVIGVLIVVGAIIGATFICISWKKKEEERKQKELNAMFSIRKPYGMSNPVFDNTDAYTEPFDANNRSVYNGCKPLETQRLSIFLPEESDADSSNPSVHDNTTTFHDPNSAILVVDDDLDKEDQHNGRGPWASPYTGDAAMPSRGTSQSSGYTSTDVEVITPSSSAGDSSRRLNRIENHYGQAAHRGQTNNHHIINPAPTSPKSEREAIKALQKLIHDRSDSQACIDRYSSSIPNNNSDVTLRKTYQTRLPEPRPPVVPPLPPPNPPARSSIRRLFPPQTHPPPISWDLTRDLDHADLPGTVQPNVGHGQQGEQQTESASGYRQSSPANPSPSSRDVTDTEVKQIPTDQGREDLMDEDPTYAKVLPSLRLAFSEEDDAKRNASHRESHYDMPKISYATVNRVKKKETFTQKPSKEPRYKTVIDINPTDRTIRSSVLKVNGRRGSKVSPSNSSAESSPTNSAGRRTSNGSNGEKKVAFGEANLSSFKGPTVSNQGGTKAGARVSMAYTEL